MEHIMSEVSMEDVKDLESLIAKLEGLREESKSRRLRIRTDENEKRIQQRVEEIKVKVENLPNIIAEMATAGEEHDSLCVDDDDLWYLAEELRGIITEEGAILKSPLIVNGFVVEPLQDGQVLIRLLSQDHDYEFTEGAYVLLGRCFAELAKVNLDRRVVNTELSRFTEQLKGGAIARSEKLTGEEQQEADQLAGRTVDNESSTQPTAKGAER